MSKTYFGQIPVQAVKKNAQEDKPTKLDHVRVEAKQAPSRVKLSHIESNSKNE